MLIAFRYLVTVRRAMSSPSAWSVAATSSSESGLLLSSFSITCRTRSFTLLRECIVPSVDRVPPVKKNFRG